jgi:hypothetical protein
MKKKVRSIIVNEKEYKWSMSRPNCDGDGGSVFQIWDGKKLIHRKVVHRVITPVDVAMKIKELDN